MQVSDTEDTLDALVATVGSRDGSRTPQRDTQGTQNETKKTPAGADAGGGEVDQDKTLHLSGVC